MADLLRPSQSTRLLRTRGQPGVRATSRAGHRQIQNRTFLQYLFSVISRINIDGPPDTAHNSAPVVARRPHVGGLCGAPPILPGGLAQAMRSWPFRLPAHRCGVSKHGLDCSLHVLMHPVEQTAGVAAAEGRLRTTAQEGTE